MKRLTIISLVVVVAMLFSFSVAMAADVTFTVTGLENQVAGDINFSVTTVAADSIPNGTLVYSKFALTKNGAPLANQQVNVLTNGTTFTTNANGEYTFDALNVALLKGGNFKVDFSAKLDPGTYSFTTALFYAENDELVGSSQEVVTFYVYDADGKYPPFPVDYAPYFNATGLNPYLHDQLAFTYADGSPIVNANLTGVRVNNRLNRSISSQRVHTNFQKNTNSCASCHMTHTAEGASLLFRASIYGTCSACHDGTHSSNVFRPTSQIVASARTNNSLRSGNSVGQAVSGTFGVDRTMNASVHLATGDMKIAAAPGGNRVGVKADGSLEGINFGGWTNDFTCASCHVPHGSYSQRLMHYNPNNVMGRLPQDGGLRQTDLQLRKLADDDGYYYLFPAGTTQYTVANAVKGPWVYGYIPGYRTDNSRQYITFQRPNGDYVPLNQFNIYYRDGKIKLNTFPAADVNSLTASVTQALVINRPVVQANGRIMYTNLDGMNYNIFCAACHTDYELGMNNIATGRGFAQGYAAGGTAASDLSGIYSEAHRHTTFRGANAGMEVAALTNQMICISCHFVHGADSLIMKTADEVVIGVAARDIDNGTAPQALLDNAASNVPNNPTGAQYINANRDIGASSALKRYTNMSVCWKCHTSSHANTLKNSDDFWDKYADVVGIWHSFNPAGQYR